MNELTVTETPMSLIRSAIEKGMGPAELAGFFELQERFEKNQARIAYAQAKNACDAAIPRVLNTTDRADTNSRFPSLDSLMEQIKPVYLSHGFSLTFGEADSPLTNHVRIEGELLHVGGHSVTRHFDSLIEAVGMKGNRKSTDADARKSAVTVGRRYLTTMIFNLTKGEKDTDGAPSAPATINAEQLAEINDLIRECNAIGPPFNLNAFRNWIGCDLLHIPTGKFLGAIAQLEAMVAKRKDRLVETTGGTTTSPF